MPLALSLFPDTDIVDTTVDFLMPWLVVFALMLLPALLAIIMGKLARLFRSPSPVDEILRRSR